jgi:Fic family protein
MDATSSKKTYAPFTAGFLSDFVLSPGILPFQNKEIKKMDRELAEYEQVLMDPDIEKHLISKNELLASFAISKAEDSSLTLKEAQQVYELVLGRKEYDFVARKLSARQKLTAKDYEKLEFFNIARTFRELNANPFRASDLSPKLIQRVHLNLTQGMDIFHEHLPKFTAYKSGKWRDNDTIRVGDYIPAPHKEIQKSVQMLTRWLKKNPSIANIAVFHTALYALHPFHNGNKRVCRVLEHVLLRSIGTNRKNLYSASYYYHKEKDRYYKYLLHSLERKNLNHFSAFVLEALVLSIISVVKTSLEAKRSSFLDETNLDPKVKAILSPLIKRKEMQFKTLFRFSRKKIARQTFVTYLQKATKEKVLVRRGAGRSVYYQLNFKTPEQEVMEKWVAFAKERLSYIPDGLRLAY